MLKIGLARAAKKLVVLENNVSAKTSEPHSLLLKLVSIPEQLYFPSKSNKIDIQAL